MLVGRFLRLLDVVVLAVRARSLVFGVLSQLISILLVEEEDELVKTFHLLEALVVGLVHMLEQPAGLKTNVSRVQIQFVENWR